MKKYTIGALFTPDFKNVLLIEKVRPEWQRGKLNFPGGHIEDGETCSECVAREFLEETELNILPSEWLYIGKINNPGNYYVDVLAAVCNNMGAIQSPTDETASWYSVDRLPENVVSNIRWLVPFAINIFKQGNADHLRFGHFEYSYENVSNRRTGR